MNNIISLHINWSIEKDYLLEGLFSFDGAYKGKGTTQSFSGQIELSEAELQHKQSGERLSGIQSSAELNSTQDKTSIRLFETNGKFRNGNVQLVGTFEFAEKTFMDIQLGADIELEEAKEFFALDTLEQFSGSLTADIKYKGFIDQEGWSAGNIRDAEINGRLVLKDAEFKLKGNKNTLSNLGATFVLIDGNAAVQGLSASVGYEPFSAEPNVTVEVFVDSAPPTGSRFTPFGRGCGNGYSQSYTTNDGLFVSEGVTAFFGSRRKAKTEFAKLKREASTIIELVRNYRDHRGDVGERLVMEWISDDSIARGVSIIFYDGGDSYRFVDAPSLDLALEFEQFLIGIDYRSPV